MTHFNRRQIVTAGAALAGSIVLPARAAGYPDRDITFILPWSPGGSVDGIARQFCLQLEKQLGGNVNVENRPGGSGTVGVGMVVRAKPDGYTIGYAGNGTLAYQPMVNKGLAWSGTDDYQPLVKLFDMPTILAVRKDSPFRNWQDFHAAVKAKPNQIKVGVSGLRTSSDMVLQQVNRLGNIKIRSVPFSGGSGESVIALLGGRIDAMAGYTEGVIGHVEADTMRVIAVFQKGVYEPFPNATPVADNGYPEATLPATNSNLAPKGLPPDVLAKLVNGTKAAVTSEEFKKFAKKAGLILNPLGPAEIRDEIKKVTVTYAQLIKFLDATKG
jgi:tripartite-type tricarboxylate transporter receptor subunit TctC